MATFVLVHGACLGGWYWKTVTPLLRAAGHEVYTPTLTGLGERSHLLSPAINLDVHIQDIGNVLDFEDLTEVTLLGHSYGGMVISGVADRVPERLSQLIYLDAYVPADGEMVFDLETPEEGAAMREQARQQGEGWHWHPPLENLSEISRRKARPQPLPSFTQPIRIKHPVPSNIARTFILCTQGRGGQRSADRILSETGWRYIEMDANHGANVMKAPSELSNLLIGLV